MNIDQLFRGAKTLFNGTTKKKSEYQLRFVHEDDGCWYVDLPDWPFSHHNLMMVAGADELCAFLSDDDQSVTVSVIPSKKQMTLEGYTELRQTSFNPSGSYYDVIDLQDFNRDIWLCPVTLFVLGSYPKYLYIKKI